MFESRASSAYRHRFDLLNYVFVHGASKTWITIFVHLLGCLVGCVYAYVCGYACGVYLNCFFFSSIHNSLNLAASHRHIFFYKFFIFMAFRLHSLDAWSLGWLYSGRVCKFGQAHHSLKPYTQHHMCALNSRIKNDTHPIPLVMLLLLLLFCSSLNVSFYFVG